MTRFGTSWREALGNLVIVLAAVACGTLALRLIDAPHGWYIALVTVWTAIWLYRTLVVPSGGITIEIRIRPGDPRKQPR